MQYVSLPRTHTSLFGKRPATDAKIDGQRFLDNRSIRPTNLLSDVYI